MGMNIPQNEFMDCLCRVFVSIYSGMFTLLLRIPKSQGSKSQYEKKLSLVQRDELQPRGVVTTGEVSRHCRTARGVNFLEKRRGVFYIFICLQMFLRGGIIPIRKNFCHMTKKLKPLRRLVGPKRESPIQILTLRKHEIMLHQAYHNFKLCFWVFVLILRFSQQ